MTKKRKHRFRANEGMTLIELLVTSSLILVMFSIGFSMYVTGIRGFLNNANALDGEANVRIAMEHISSSFRNVNTFKVEGDILKIGLDTYRLKGDILYVNINQLATGISEFTICEILPHQVYIRISSKPNGNGKSFTLETWLTVRRL